MTKAGRMWKADAKKDLLAFQYMRQERCRDQRSPESDPRSAMTTKGRCDDYQRRLRCINGTPRQESQMAQPSNNTASAPNVEDLLKTFITALQTLRHQAQNSGATANAEEDESNPSSQPSQGAPPLDEATPTPVAPLPTTPGEPEKKTWETRIWRPDGKGGWITHQEYQRSSIEPPPEERATETDSTPAVVYEDYNGEKKRLEIHSKHLVEAIKHVNKHPPLQPLPDFTVEFEPFPTLFHHLEDVRREIDKLNNQEAQVDFQALEFITKEVASRWKEVSLNLASCATRRSGDSSTRGTLWPGKTTLAMSSSWFLSKSRSARNKRATRPA